MVVIDDKSLLLVVDVQNDFISGSLAVPNAKSIIPVINEYSKRIPNRVFSRDMHPDGHSSFSEQGGPWPPHCVVGTIGCRFHKDLNIAEEDMVINKGTKMEKDAYSAFDGTNLPNIVKAAGFTKIFICGLATDYCVKATVLDACSKLNIPVYLLIDAIGTVNINPKDGIKAMIEMIRAGARLVRMRDLGDT